LEIASALNYLYPKQYEVTMLEGLMRNKSSLDAIVAGEDPRRIAEAWQDAVSAFISERKKYLLY
jgi:hypothetical protein